MMNQFYINAANTLRQFHVDLEEMKKPSRPQEEVVPKSEKTPWYRIKPSF
jgi:hypothetical protein